MKKELKIIIYKVTNINNGKIYVGQTRFTLQRRRGTHLNYSLKKTTKMVFHSAIRKYGIDDFVWEIIEDCNNDDTADELEIYYIDKLNSLIPNGYNLLKGGSGASGWKMSDEEKLKRSKRMKENNPMKNPETQKKLSINGYFNTTKFKEKMSIIRKTEDFINKQSIAKLGNKNPNAKKWIITNPDGEEFEIDYTLAEFCRENNLNYRHMKAVNCGGKKQHKGWKCKSID